MGDEVSAADPVLGFSAVGERRRHARVLAGWRRAKGEARFPAWSDAAIDPRCGSDGGAALFFLGDAGIEVVGCDDRLAAQAWSASFLERIVDRVAAVQAQRAPLGCEAEIMADGRETLLRGLMLPYADQIDELRFVQLIVSWREAAIAAVDVQAAAHCAAELAVAEPVRWATRKTDVTFDERFAIARTWAALAQADASLRPRSLSSALSALFDAELAGADGKMIAAALDEIFAEGFSPRERRQLKRVLTHATRLGLGSGGLAALLGSYPGGIAAMARLEARIERQDRLGSPAASAVTSITLRLLAVDPAARSPDRCNIGDHALSPWEAPAARAA